MDTTKAATVTVTAANLEIRPPRKPTFPRGSLNFHMGKRVRIGSRVYEVDEKGTVRRIHTPLGERGARRSRAG